MTADAAREDVVHARASTSPPPAAPPRNRGTARPPWPARRLLLDCPHPLPPVQKGLHGGDVHPGVRVQAGGDDLARHGDALAPDLFDRSIAVLAPKSPAR